MGLILRRARIEKRETFENINCTLLAYGYFELTFYGNV